MARSQYLLSSKNGSRNNSFSLLLFLAPRKGFELTLCTITSTTMDLSWLLASEKRQNAKSRLQATFCVGPRQICVFGSMCIRFSTYFTKFHSVFRDKITLKIFWLAITFPKIYQKQKKLRTLDCRKNVKNTSQRHHKRLY